MRMPFIVACQMIVLVGYSILFVKAFDVEGNVALCYFAVILSCIGLYPIQPGTSAWTVNNVAGPKRALGIAYMICLGNLGGVIGSFIYKKSEQPAYPTGFGTSLGFAALGVVLCLGLELSYNAINKHRDGMTREDVNQRYTEAELSNKGDRSPLFRYTL
ncbi:high-affinity nicotinic acid transporter [Fusarium albosuccineum]|uniref:High-affinity nicotinic acid transporter n=1 Tax=Fusarium albosuccineum TaxID=1237068 RepID=A0A8H4L390_9HYPO|nr:high-affinity nicotinic acid transporter [Fusarium albosuccineum]